MNEKIFSRTEMLIGKTAMEKLHQSCVAVFGLGGVGSFAAEALARAGVGALTLIDFDTVDETNINRQLHANINTMGQKKTFLMKERIAAINPEAKVTLIDGFYDADNAEQFFLSPYDYVADAIDTVAGKISLALECRRRNIPIICSMGAGNKLDPARFCVTDIYKTHTDPLARIMRKKLKDAGIPALKVVFSDEIPQKVFADSKKEETKAGNAGGEPPERKTRAPGSISFVPSAAGLIMAGEIVRDLIKND